MNADVVQQKRHLRMDAEPFTGEDPRPLAQQLLRHRKSLEQIPELRFKGEQGVCSLQVRAAANVQEIIPDPLGKGGQSFRLLTGNFFKCCGRGHQVEGQSLAEGCGQRSGQIAGLEQA